LINLQTVENFSFFGIVLFEIYERTVVGVALVVITLEAIFLLTKLYNLNFKSIIVKKNAERKDFIYIETMY